MAWEVPGIQGSSRKPGRSNGFGMFTKSTRFMKFKGVGMYLVFPVIVIVTVIVLLQCLSCSFGQNQKVNMADIIMTMTMTKKNKIQNRSVSPICMHQCTPLTRQLAAKRPTILNKVLEKHFAVIVCSQDIPCLVANEIIKLQIEICNFS